MASAEKDTRVAVMGATGSGKSTFINVASGSNLVVGNSLESCTIEVEPATFLLDGRTVTLIDTPGFDDTTRSDTEVLESITDYLSSSYSQGAKLAGMIYMHRISDNRMGGPSRRNFHLLRNLCGDTNLRNVLLVTSMWSGVDPEVGNAREGELASNDKFFKPGLDKGARMLRHDGSQTSAHAILRHLVGLEPSTLLVQDEMVNQEKDLAHTTAGAEMTRELKEQTGRHEKTLAYLCQGIEGARIAQDDETTQILQEEANQAREKIERMQGDLERMASKFGTEQSRLEYENRRYKREFKKQKADAKHTAQLYKQERRARETAEARQKQAEVQLATERESREHEKREREREEHERQERERQEQEKEECERQECERREREREEYEREEHERREQERQEYERQERERQERERQEYLSSEERRASEALRSMLREKFFDSRCHMQ